MSKKAGLLYGARGYYVSAIGNIIEESMKGCIWSEESRKEENKNIFFIKINNSD